MKNSYILLRNNKESGPFSLEQLQAMALNAGDLVWVEGQSVAWLRPAEIPSLRNIISTAGIQAEKKAEEKPDTKASESATADIPKPNVFVSLPAVEKPDVYREPVYQEQASAVSDAEKEIPKTKFERPLDEIKDMYVKTMEERKKKTARKKRVAKQVRYAAIVLGLVLIGALAGIAIQRSMGNKSSNDTGTESGQQAVQTPVNTAQTPDTLPAQQQDITDEEVVTVPSVTEMAEETRAIQPAEKTKDLSQTRVDDTESKNEQKEETVRSVPADRPREKQTATADVDALRTQVAVKANDYKTGSFGGIRGLQLTVTNESSYALEKVVVELQYLKLGDEVVKSEFVQFRSVPANGRQTIDIPSSKRGIKVAYKIRTIDPEPKANVAGF